MANIRALRRFVLDGREVPAGTVINAPELDAGEVVATGRAEFVSDSDRTAVIDAVSSARMRSFRFVPDPKPRQSWIHNFGE